MKTQTRTRQSGWTMMELMIVMAVLGLLAAVATPGFLKARSAGWRNVCISNLRKISDAKTSWAMEHRHGPDSILEERQLVGSSNYLRRMPVCPAGGVYLLGAVEDPPVCSLARDHGHRL